MLDPFSLITAPVLGPVQMVRWLGQKLIEAAESELYDAERLKTELVDLEARYDMGEISDEEYAEAEERLIKRMSLIREAKGE